MSDQHEVITEHEARIAELEQQLASLQGVRPVASTRLSRRRLAAVGLAVALLAVPGVVFAGHHFSDVPDGHPFHDDIDWLADYGISQGFADGTYRPGQAVTRQAMAAFMHRLSNEFEIVRSEVNPGSGSGFFHFVACPDDKRPIAGSGRISHADLFLTDSYPANIFWNVAWESDDDAVVDPSFATVWALCAPRL